MLGNQFFSSSTAQRVHGAETAATSAVNSSALDVDKFHSLAFLVCFGAVAGTPKIQLQGSDDGSTWKDVDDEITLAATDDNKVVIVEDVETTYKKYRVQVDRTNASSAIVAILGFACNARYVSEAKVHDSTKTIHKKVYG